MAKRRKAVKHHGLHLPKTKLGKAFLGVVVLPVVLAGITAYLVWHGNISAKDLANVSALGSSDGSVTIISPAAGAVLTTGSQIHGTSNGAGTVNIWVSGVNFATPVQMDGRVWREEDSGGAAG